MLFAFLDLVDLYLPSFLPSFPCYLALFLFRNFRQHGSDPRDVHPGALEDVVAQHVCFALLVGRHGARSQADGSVGACAAALGERAWVDA